MSHSRKDGHGRCGACGDAGLCRRHREAAWQKADERELEQELEEQRRRDSDNVAILMMLAAMS